MNLHEYQAKRLLRERAIPVPDGGEARTVQEARAVCERLGGARWAVKAQIHAGARGKAGGVVLCDDPEAVAREAQRLLGSRLVTAQTGPRGLPVETLLIERPTAIARELYLGVLVDRASERVVFMASAAGGVDIEAVAAATPERILRLAVHPATGLRPYHARRLGYGLGLERDQIAALGRLLAALYTLAIDHDATLIEMNPLVVTEDGELVALDAKIELDENALYRHSALTALRDPGQEDDREAAARAHALNYISLEGNIGCMVNGAGLAMATMDLVKLHGGAPANFLDVGGGATAERVAEAFKLILSDPKVEAVLVNIFGGIVRCDLIAEGIMQAVREVQVAVPVVVRLEGTNAAQGRALLAASGLALEPASSLNDAAARVVALAGGAREEQGR
ncbi:ADP-forming succinate--CoA ligase subunit beta [Marichromatium gracile]|uniref:Succinate--CoA ligase [ADP-forming] subunit beta n=1 Tax=Marichromatium gracile TaxID=1048 RepID=A0A4R4A7C4_MARGR|nr:ADP-forming succinate--CoA ligase subunit beta [Marichromatium gracile]MBK1709079.1 succinate--CoA ligase subunit beta [Marichromatium gracile]TCW34737.1 succinyl-CoA synthetase (ADP-forming) beta subunit [Marichromatium gracile]